MKRPEMIKFIKSLSKDDSLKVMNTLIDEAPDVTRKMYDIALAVVTGIDSDKIRDSVFCALEDLSLDALNNRAGKTRYGYVEPAEEAWVMFEEALDPFIKEMKKNQQRALPIVAKTYCIGIIKGLRRYEKESYSDFSEWVDEAPGEYIETAVDQWKEGNPSKEDISEVMSFIKGDQS